MFTLIFTFFFTSNCVFYSMLPVEFLEYTVSMESSFIFKAYQSVHSDCYATLSQGFHVLAAFLSGDILS